MKHMTVKALKDRRLIIENARSKYEAWKRSDEK